MLNKNERRDLFKLGLGITVVFFCVVVGGAVGLIVVAKTWKGLHWIFSLMG